MSTGLVVPRKRKILPPLLKVSMPVHEEEKKSVPELFKVAPQVFMSGYEVAKNKDLLISNSITHILNLAGESKCPNLYPDIFHYFSLKMPDNPKVDILFFLYFALGFVLDSLEKDGKVLIHCVKGTSRSAAVALAYLMHIGLSEQDAYFSLNSNAPNIDPNFGFVCQLREFKNLKEELRKFVYSPKYDIFVNSHQCEGPYIEVCGKECVLYIPPNSIPYQVQLALESVHLWEKFNKSEGAIVYL